MRDLIDRQQVIDALMTDASYQMVDDWGNLTQDGEVILRVINEVSSIIEPSAGNHWIPITVQIPEYGIEVLTINVDGEYEINHIIDEEDGEWFFNGVTAWMPLPEVYKGGA